MKKLSFYALGAAMAAVLFTFTACGDPANDTENPGGGTGGNGDDVRLIDKITQISNDGNEEATVTLSYDDKNRIVKANVTGNYYAPEEHLQYTYSYGDNSVTLTYDSQYLNDGVLCKDFSISTYKTNTDGNIVSMDSFSYEYWSDGELVDDYSGSSSGATYDYEGGYLKQFTDPEYANIMDADGNIIATTNLEETYLWTNGNLTGIESTETYIDADSNDGFTPGEPHEETVVLTYSDKINPVNVSIDQNASFVFSSEYATFLEMLGFLGKSPKNLVSSVTTIRNDGSEHTTNYTWELDSEGYITKVSSTDEYEAYTATITYKN